TKRECQELVAMCLLLTIRRLNRERRKMPATSANPLSPKTTLKIGITKDLSSVRRLLRNKRSRLPFPWKSSLQPLLHRTTLSPHLRLNMLKTLRTNMGNPPKTSQPMYQNHPPGFYLCQSSTSSSRLVFASVVHLSYTRIQ